ncbi:glutamate racemase [Natronincola ferrireducens]|uniref:Glutamate racemase n=1 Tax=Natronincola ferrireducens TaxID=393762 RepID=A0A1G8ZNF4_9FIRM|nr:glutamate racemase [Natronincola ferrireducens]SDK15680.1 glutamate racemase [Natronincola ferrireducens]
MKYDSDLAIGVFDSGVGGISVLAELIHRLPKEKYIYYGDSKNAPYGMRTTEEVKALSLNVVEELLKIGIKGLVVACNTATSGVIEDLRKAIDIPIVGMEPALKPAVELNKAGKIIVMATPVTLREKKFNNLIQCFDNRNKIIKLPCPGLVEIIEKNGGRGEEIRQYLHNLFKEINIEEIDSIVLGCTHYIFIKEELNIMTGNRVQLIDGNRGTANQLKRLLTEENLLHMEKNQGYTEITMINSLNTEDIIDLSKKLLEEQLHYLGWQGRLKYNIVDL